MTDYTPVLRTDFSDEDAWIRLRDAIQNAWPDEDGNFCEYVDIIDDPAFAGFDAEAVVAAVPDVAEAGHDVVLVVDREALLRPDNAVLVVDPYGEPMLQFRVIPSQLYGLVIHLDMLILELETYADSADSDGVFRGF